MFMPETAQASVRSPADLNNVTYAGQVNKIVFAVLNNKVQVKVKLQVVRLVRLQLETNLQL